MSGGEKFLMSAITSTACYLYKNDSFSRFRDKVAREEQVTVYWPGVEPVYLWTSPLNLEEFVLGHCTVELCTPGIRPILERREGKIFYLRPVPWPVLGDFDPEMVDPELLLECMHRFIRESGKWEETGCFHRAAAVDAQGSQLRMAEDVSRHGCIDRISGWALSRQEDLSSDLLFISSRATASLLRKARLAGFKVVACRAAVTTAAIELAQQEEITLIGFLRDHRLTVFSDPMHRIRHA